jgi:hypothetical protein
MFKIFVFTNGTWEEPPKPIRVQDAGDVLWLELGFWRVLGPPLHRSWVSIWQSAVHPFYRTKSVNTPLWPVTEPCECHAVHITLMPTKLIGSGFFWAKFLVKILEFCFSSVIPLVLLFLREGRGLGNFAKFLISEFLKKNTAYRWASLTNRHYLTYCHWGRFWHISKDVAYHLLDLTIYRSHAFESQLTPSS